TSASSRCTCECSARTGRARSAATGRWTSSMARTSRTMRTDRLRSEAGSIMIEALVAAAILLGGAAATITAFDSTTQASHTSEREAEAVSIAEKELERIVGEPYAQINNCAAPSAGTGRSDDPQSWVQ